MDMDRLLAAHRREEHSVARTNGRRRRRGPGMSASLSGDDSGDEGGTIAADAAAFMRDERRLHRAAVRRKPFPTALLCATGTCERRAASLQLTRSGFVVEECPAPQSVLAQWSFPRNHDVVLLFAVMGEFTGAFFAQEVRRAELGDAAQRSAKQRGRQQGRHVRGLNPVNGEPLPDEFDGTEAARNVMLLTAHARRERSYLVGCFYTKLERDAMEATGAFDMLLHLPLDSHVHVLQELFVSHETVQRLRAMPTYHEMAAQLSAQMSKRGACSGDALMNTTGRSDRAPGLLSHCISGHRSALDSGAASDSAFLRGIRSFMSTIEETADAGGSARVFQLEDRIRALEDHIEGIESSVRAAEQETDVANKNAQALQARLDDVEAERDGLLANVESLSELLKLKVQEIEAQRDDFVAFLHESSKTSPRSGSGSITVGGSAKLAAAVGENGRAEPASSGIAANATEGTVTTARQQGLQRLVAENQRLRDAVFDLQSEVHIAKTETASLSTKYVKMKERLTAELATTTSLREKMNSKEQPQHGLSHSQRREEEQRRLSSASSSSFSKFATEAFDTGVGTALTFNTNDVPLAAGSDSDPDSRGTSGATATAGAAECSETKVAVPPRPAAPPAASRGASRLRASIVRVQRIIKAKTIFDSIRGEAKQQQPTTAIHRRGAERRHWGVIAERYECALMEAHDAVSRSAVFHNTLSATLRAVPPQQAVRVEDFVLKGGWHQPQTDGGGVTRTLEDIEVAIVCESARRDTEETERSLVRLLRVSTSFAEESAVGGALEERRRERLRNSAGVAAVSGRLRELLIGASPAPPGDAVGASPAPGSGLHGLYEQVLHPFKFFLEGVIAKQRALLGDIVVEAMRLFVGEARLVALQPRIGRAASGGCQPCRRSAALETGVAEDDADGLFANGEESKPLDATRRSEVGLATARSSAGDVSQQQRGGARLSVARATMSTPLTHREVLQLNERLDAEHSARMREVAEAQVEARRRFVLHFGRHFHHVLRKGILAAQALHTQHIDEFRRLAAGSITAMDRIVQPLQQRLDDAVASGTIAIRHDYGTQTERRADAAVLKGKRRQSVSQPSGISGVADPAVGSARRQTMRMAIPPAAAAAAAPNRRPSGRRLS